VRRIDVRVDVSEVAGVSPAEQVVTLVAPKRRLHQTDVLMFGYPGGTFARGYFDVQWQGTADYSQAEYHASRGWVVACIDHLGVGESTIGAFDLDTIARADAVVAQTIGDGLRAGTLTPEFPEVDVGTTIGVGQSMGGYLATVAQAVASPFDAIAVLGSSAIHTVLPTPDGAPGMDLDYAYFWEDVDPAIVAADSAGPPQAPWRSATTPAGAAGLLQPGVATEVAAAVTTPVFVGAGERDVLPDPWAEPTAYGSSHDISLVVVERMAHMHNFASTRQHLWERLHAWGEGL
jgi:hypothetical protein